MTKEVKNVPDLRFPGFENTWETKKLHQIVDVKDGTHESPKPTDDGYLLVTSKNLKNSTLDFSESYSISKEDYEDINKRSKVEIGDILFGMIGTIGNPILLEKDGFAIKNVALLKTSSLQEREYILNFLKSNSITKQFYKLNVGGTQKFISLRSIRDLKIDIPSSEEAIKIGGFFNKLDQQIELEEQKLSLLEEQKKGYMQKIFSQELRFKDEKGNDYPEWKTKKLDELGEFNSGVGFPEKYQGGNTGVPFFKVSDMNLLGNEKFMNTANNYVSIEQIKQKKWKVIQSVPAIIFAKVGAAIMLNRKRMILNPFLIDNNTMSYSFFNHWDTNFGYVVFQMLNLPKYAQVGALPSYNSKDIGIIQIRLPIKEEQEKIGDFFSKLDEHIDKQSQKIDRLKLRKQGFLQKMFI